MMVVANPDLCAQLAAKIKWPSLYWWNSETPGQRPVLQNHKLEAPTAISVPAYNFDLMFQKMRPFIKTQADAEQLATMKILLEAPNPADALCRLALKLTKTGLIK